MPKLNPTFDPDWKPRFDRALAKSNITHVADDVSTMHEAFWRQFRTMAEIRDFHFDALRKRAEGFGLDIILPVLDDNCSWEEIIAVYHRGSSAIDDSTLESYRPPYMHPDGLDAFCDDQPDAQRFTERYEYVGFWNTPSACIMTIEFQEAAAHVCFTLINRAGTSPINMIEELAAKVYHEHLADRYGPAQAHWYAYFHIQTNEGFMEAELRWDRRANTYVSQGWRHFGSVPQVITLTADLAAQRPDLPRVARRK